MKLYISACSEYPLHELEVTDWLAKEKGLDTISTGDISIRSETENAYRIEIWIAVGDAYMLDGYKWLPKSHCKIVKRTGPKQTN